MLFLRGGRRVSQQERNGRLMVGFWCLQKACTTVLFFVFWSKKIGASQLLFFVAFRHCHLGTPPPLTLTLRTTMDFVFSNAPSRIVAMTRPMAWAALDEGHAIFEERGLKTAHGEWNFKILRWRYPRTPLCTATRALWRP